MKKKQLIEKRNGLIDKMDALIAACETEEEVRAFTDEEQTEFNTLEAEIKAISGQISAIETRELLEQTFEDPAAGDAANEEERRALDESNFLSYIRGETRALDIAQNGGIIPAHIANQIIEVVKELSPIYALATVYNVGGDLIFPIYDEGTSSIGAAFVDDMQELTEGTGKFTTVRLENFIVGCLAKISKSLMNRTDFDLMSFVVRKVGQAIAEFLEFHLIQGATGKNEGILSAPQVLVAPSATALTADDLIDLQMSVVMHYQTNACWVMHKNTLKALRKLKDSTGEYLLNKDITTPFGWSILGKPVYITESMPQIAAEERVIVYGDMSGLYVKLAQDIELQLLLEKYSTQHAVGVVGYVEFDSRVVEPQKMTVLEMAP
ncbi:MAG: phage major capsid protein [Oscillospiraceae bacterium]|nr:phage major capsid protein [Oscillospiraceae bacterium]